MSSMLAGWRGKTRGQEWFLPSFCWWSVGFCFSDFSASKNSYVSSVCFWHTLNMPDSGGVGGKLNSPSGRNLLRADAASAPSTLLQQEFSVSQIHVISLVGFQVLLQGQFDLGKYQGEQIFPVCFIPETEEMPDPPWFSG